MGQLVLNRECIGSTEVSKADVKAGGIYYARISAEGDPPVTATVIFQ
jgi:hypothetical protein